MKKNIELFDIQECISQVESILHDKAHMKNILMRSVFENFQKGYSLVKTDRKRLQQVLLNLLSNAMKFTQRNGSVLIRVQKLT